MVSAVVLIKAQVESIAEIAGALTKLRGVTQVFSVAGHYDLVVLLHVQENEELADLVSERIRKVQGIVETETLIAFRVYDPAEMGLAGSFGLD
jgi:DNA-binding Lrp family transcriptional regulator